MVGGGSVGGRACTYYLWLWCGVCVCLVMVRGESGPLGTDTCGAERSPQGWMIV